MVWEKHMAHALQAGPAEISFTPVRDSDYCCVSIPRIWKRQRSLWLMLHGIIV